MFTAYVVVAVVLAAFLLMSGRGKLVKDERVVKPITGIGVPLSWFPWLAAAEIAGAAGLLAGIGVKPLGVAASIGTVLYFVGAVAGHLRARDFRGVSAPVAPLALAVAALLLRLAAH